MSAGVKRSLKIAFLETLHPGPKARPATGSLPPETLREDILYDPRLEVGGQPLSLPIKLIKKLLMVESQLVQDGRVEVRNADRIFNRPKAKVIRSPVDRPAFNASASQPQAERFRIVIPALYVQGAPLISLGHLPVGKTSELAPPDDQSTVEQASLLEIFEKGSNRLIGSVASTSYSIFQVGVIIPNLTVQADLNIPDSSLNQSPRHDATARVIVRSGISILYALQARPLPHAVHLQCRLALFREVQGSTCFQLHARSQLIGSYACIDLWLRGVHPLVSLVESIHQPSPQLDQLRRILYFRPEV